MQIWRRKLLKFFEGRSKEDGTGNFEIYLIKGNGASLSRVTKNSSEDVTPQFSRDGRRIVFSSNRSGKFALYKIEIL